MKSAGISRVLRKLRAYERMTRSGLDEARQWLLLSVIDQYLALSAAEGAELDGLLAPPDRKEVRNTMLAYEERGHRLGLEQGIAQGLSQGQIAGFQQALLRQMRRRFGDLPAEAVDHVQALADTDALGALLDKVFEVSSIDDLGLMGTPNPTQPA